MHIQSNQSKTFVIIAGFIVCLLVSGKQAQAVWYVNSYGSLVEMSSGQVLGKDDSGGGESHGGSSDSEDSHSESGSSSQSESSNSGSSGNSSSEPENIEPTDAQHPTEVRRSEPPRITPTGFVKREIRVSETPRMRLSITPRVRISEMPRKLDLTNVKPLELRDDASKPARIRFENRGKDVQIRTENKQKETHDIDAQKEVEIEPHQDANKVKIATSGADKLEFTRNKVGAETKMPLSVNPDTNELSVETPKGTKVVTVLPDAAVQNILMNKVIDSVDSSSSDSAHTTVTLSTDGDKTVYEMKGPKNKKVFGLFPVTIQKTVTVSTDTGAVVKEDKSLADTFLDFISF